MPQEACERLATLDAPGIVLQVAAASHEENADALLQSLTGENFPAFVFRRGTDPLYKVRSAPTRIVVPSTKRKRNWRSRA